MMKFVRTNGPDWLKDNWLNWGIRYLQNKAKNKNFNFQWAQYNNKDTGKLIREKLLPISKNHCCFCDSHPLESMIKESVEHFKPKALYPLEVYCWENLFVACDICQEKGNKFSHKLLKPDTPEYEFDRYFIYNASTGEIEPNPSSDWESQERAFETITLYKLNDNRRPETRKRMKKVWGEALNNKEVELDECPYRFMFL